MKTLAITDSPKGDGNYRGVSVPKPIYERARAASDALGMVPSNLAAMALDLLLRELEEANGGPFPPRHGKMPGGRPTNAQRRAAGLIP